MISRVNKSRIINLEISIKKIIFLLTSYNIYTIEFNILKKSNTLCYIKWVNKMCKYASIYILNHTCKCQ